MVKHLPLQIAVAAHDNLSESTAAKLMKLQVRELRRALAGNTRIPRFVMHRLSRDYIDVRVRLAKNPAVPLAIMKRFAVESDHTVRISLTRNVHLHTEIMEQLSRDQNEEVRASLTQHPHLPVGGLRAMTQDPSSKVRAAVLERALADFATDQAIFKALAKAKNCATAEAAEVHLNQLREREKAMRRAQDQD
jgi:hypothetical protein